MVWKMFRIINETNSKVFTSVIVVTALLEVNEFGMQIYGYNYGKNEDESVIIDNLPHLIVTTIFYSITLVRYSHQKRSYLI